MSVGDAAGLKGDAKAKAPIPYFKILILGNSGTSTCRATHEEWTCLVGTGVGKSSLLVRFAENTFSPSYITTIGSVTSPPPPTAAPSPRRPSLGTPVAARARRHDPAALPSTAQPLGRRRRGSPTTTGSLGRRRRVPPTTTGIPRRPHDRWAIDGGALGATGPAVDRMAAGPSTLRSRRAVLAPRPRAHEAYRDADIPGVEGSVAAGRGNLNAP